MVMMFVFLLLWSSEGCLEHERSALLQISRYWVTENSADCCQWYGVACNNTTGRVIKLRYLGDNSVRGYDEDRYLNASLFTPFQQLETLDLSDGNIAGFVENGGLEKLSELSKLNVLDLGYNSFNNSILSSLNGLSSLKTLYLNDNKLEGSIDVQELDNFTNLKRLYLRDNTIDRLVFPKGLEKLSKLSKLEILDLSSNSFNNSILSSLNDLSSLTTLYLDGNKLEGSIDIRELDNLTNLEELDLSFNAIDRLMILKGIEKKLSKLKVLDLRYNSFSNNILSSLSGLSSLTTLDLSNNILKGSIDIQELDNLTNLEALDLSGNEIERLVISKGIEEKLSKLKFLDLNFNSFNNSILSSISGFSSLTILFLRSNKLEGSINVRELDALTNLYFLDLSYNEINRFEVPKDYRGLRNLTSFFLSGTRIRDGNKLLQSMGSFQSLKSLTFSDTNFTGTVITHPLQNFSNLENLEFYYSTLDISILQSIAAFTSLKSLMMQSCKLNGDLRELGYLDFKNLEDFHMYDTGLNSSFLPLSESMASLKSLILYNSSLSGTILDQGLCRLVHLKEIDISGNYLRGTLPWCWANLTSLESLDISSNQFTGNISSSPLIHLTSIVDLDLSDNHFQIPISLELFFNLSNLKYFYGSNNEIYEETESHSLAPKFQLFYIVLSGYGNLCTFPKFLYHQHHLLAVDLSHNNLTGGFPNWLLKNNRELSSLLLVNNSLSGPFQLIHSHVSLKNLDVSNNKFQGHIPVDIGELLPGLRRLNISMNAFSRSIPSSFGNMSILQSLDLSHNQLTGEIPKQLAMGCFQLVNLALSNNRLQGQIFSDESNLKKLVILDLDGNHFTGEIPKSLFNCTSLEKLYLSDNYLSGKIPRWLGNLSMLQHIMISKNQFEGHIPVEFCQLDSLEILDISYNNIFGSLPSCFNPRSIKRVHLSKNLLHGELKEATLFKSSSLETLDIGFNYFNGSIPIWIDRLSQLSHLILAHNNFEGEVPIQLCQLNQLRLIDLSDNYLSGHIPPCLHISTLDESYDNTHNSIIDEDNSYERSNISYRGKEISETFEFTTKNIAYTYHGIVVRYMSGLDLSCNKLIGEIPPQIGNLTTIHSLNLSHNNLTGSIPSTFSNLKQVESLDLSYNKLNGKIPHQLMELNTLAVFSVAYNNLSGKTPDRIAQFATFENSSYEGNPFLCGLPLPKSCNENEPPTIVPEASTDSGEYDNLIDMDSFYITFTTSYVVVILGIIGALYVNPYWRRKWFYLAESWMTSCYYFVVDNLIPTRFCHRN